MNGQTTGRARRESHEGRDLSHRSGPDVWADGRRDRRLAGEVSTRRGERAAEPATRRRRGEGRADQEAQTEDWGSRAGQRHFTGGLEALWSGRHPTRESERDGCLGTTKLSGARREASGPASESRTGAARPDSSGLLSIGPPDITL